jgi:guanosine-3',5'-bis(diphosphate) 3'-pyrophosphohydrolase
LRCEFRYIHDSRFNFYDLRFTTFSPPEIFMNVSKILEAARFAARKHHGQFRKGAEPEPYIVHPLEVANLLTRVGQVEDADIVIAALLHDTIEDTETSADEITERFGERVTSIVLEVTDDKSLPKERRKELQVEHAPHLSVQAKQLKICDKISNIKDIIENPPDWPYERKIEYVEWGERVFAGLKGANELLERQFAETVAEAKRKLNGE